MTTATELSKLIAPIVRLQADTVARHGLYLRKAGLMPAEDEPLSAEDAATLLISVLAARAPTEAVAAVRAFGALALRAGEVYRTDGVTSSGSWSRVENLAIAAGDGPLFASISQSLMAALAYCLLGLGNGDEQVPPNLLIVRSLAAPEAILLIAEGEGRRIDQARFSFGPAEEERARYALVDLGVQTWISAPPLLFAATAELLFGPPIEKLSARSGSAIGSLAPQQGRA